MISIIITTFNEPETINKAMDSFLNQNIEEEYEILVVCPDESTIKIINAYSEKYPQIKHVLDEGKGKSTALNKALKIAKGELVVLTDGDVYVSKNSIEEILEYFKDKSVGCVTGRPLSQNERNNMFGYWSHLLCYAAHKMRSRRDKKGRFLECSGYLWAFRNGIIEEIPIDTAEDTIVPIMFFLKGYKIKYAPNAEVYIKYPTNLKEFIDQKQRTAKGHGTLGNYVNISQVPRMKSMKNEILESYTLFLFPRKIKEFFWTIWLFPFRFYIWMLSFYRLKIKKDSKVDGWQAVKSTK